MKRRRRKRHNEEVEMQMGPMIDMVFLLLVFFMVSAKPIKEESEIQIALPGLVEPSESIEIPDEQRIYIHTSGSVVLNDLTMAKPEDKEMPRLVKTLTRFRLSCEANKTNALVTISPEPEVLHQRQIDVLNACAIAGFRWVTFDTAKARGGGDDF